MATREQLMQALRNADAAGDEASARRIAQMIQNAPQEEAASNEVPAQSQQQRRMSAAQSRKDASAQREALEKARTDEIAGLPEIGSHPMLSTLSGDALSREGLNLAIGFLSAPDDEFADIIKSNLADSDVRKTELGNYIVSTPEGEYSLNKPGISTRDVESLLFRAGVALPAGRTAAAGIPAIARVAGQEAAVEGGLQAAEAAAGGEFSPEQIAMAGGLGGTAQGLGELVSLAGRGATGNIPQQELDIINTGAESGIPVMTSDLVNQTRAGKLAAQTGELVPVAGTGGQRKAQQEGRVSLAESIRDSYPFAGPEEVFKSLQRQTSKVRKAAGAARGNIVDNVAATRSNLSNTLPTINKELQRLQFLPNGKARQNVDTETVNALKRYKTDLVNDRSFGGVEKLRTQFREDVKSNRDNPITTTSEAGINRIYDAITKDLDSVVKSELGDSGFRKWKNSNAIYADETRKINKSRFKNILEKGDITPERVTDLLKSKKPSEINQLYKSLDNTGRSAGRASIISDAAKVALGEDGVINPTKFLNELNKNKQATNIFFKGKDKKILEGYRKLLGATRRGQEFTATPPTGQALAGGTALGASFFDPSFLGAGLSAGALARVYESPAMRDFLLKLSNTPANSSKFDDLLRQSLPGLNALAVSEAEALNIAEEAQRQ